jgi:hypothetical protein
VLPSGLDVGARLRAVIADGGLGPGTLKLTDLALFDLGVVAIPIPRPSNH